MMVNTMNSSGNGVVKVVRRKGESESGLTDCEISVNLGTLSVKYAFDGLRLFSSILVE